MNQKNVISGDEIDYVVLKKDPETARAWDEFIERDLIEQDRYDQRGNGRCKGCNETFDDRETRMLRDGVCRANKTWVICYRTNVCETVIDTSRKDVPGPGYQQFRQLAILNYRIFTVSRALGRYIARGANLSDPRSMLPRNMHGNVDRYRPTEYISGT